MGKRKAPTVAEEFGWWQRRLVRWGAAVGALVIIVGTGHSAFVYLDGRYAQAGDVQQIGADILELRRDQLDNERRDLVRAQRQRKLSDPEIDRLQKLNELIGQVDRRLEGLREKKAGR